MYDIIKGVIDSKRYELADMLKKIDTIWLQGDITEEQKEEFVELARTNAQPENSYAPLWKQVNQAFSEINALKVRVAALEGGGEEQEEYPEWVQPSGAHDAYGIGDKVTYNGKKYVSKIDGNVWSPDTYPQGWEEVKA